MIIINIKDFLSKEKVVQVDILEQLFYNNLPVSKKQLQSNLNISAFMLDRQLSELKILLKEMEIDISIIDKKNGTNNYISVVKGDNANVTLIYSYLLRSSLNYKILKFVFLKGNYSIEKLSMLTYVSQATLYRNINEINTILKDYSLKLESGKIHGDEVQICSFYYQLFFAAESYDNLLKLEDSFNNKNIISGIEKIINIKINPLDRLRLLLWIEIMKRRRSANNTHFHLPEQIVDEAKKNSIYIKFRENYYRYSSIHTSPNSEHKCILLYMFLISTFIIPKPVSEKEINNFYDLMVPVKSIVNMNHVLFTFLIKKLHIDLNNIPKKAVLYWLYIFTQVHTQLLLFNGEILNFDYFSGLDIKSTYDLTKLFKLAEELIVKVETYLNVKIKKTIVVELMKIYVSILYEAYSYYTKVIEVGFASYKGYLAANSLFYSFKSNFNIDYNFHSEIASPNVHYDLILTDSLVATKNLSFDKIYILYDINSNYDILRIKNILNTLMEDRYV